VIENNTYEVQISLNDQVIDIPNSNFSFTIKDSINQFYPTANLKIDDFKGTFSEYFSFINGIKINIVYGLEGNSISCPFAVVKNSLPNQSNASSFGGTIETKLVHYNSTTLDKKSFAYKDEISNIIKKINKNLKTNIDSTENKGIWYQPMVDDVEFMENYLLPFAYSATASNTPFFLFIDNNNELYFQSYNTLMNKSAIELKMAKHGTRESYGSNTIFSVYPYQGNIQNTKFNTCFYNFTKQQTFMPSNEDIKKLRFKGGKIPIIKDLTKVTNTCRLYSEEIDDADLKNNNNGLKINNFKSSFLCDKLILTLGLNVNLRAGKKIKITLPSSNDKEISELSVRYTGEYLIESSMHNWAGSQGLTTLVVSRQGNLFANNYRIVKNIIGS
jgi:hypothetical protein